MQQRWRLRYSLQEIDLQPGRTTLGRAAECPITLEDPLVSRHHAEIHVGEAGCMLVDLGSRNGVRVNGIRLTAPRVLRANDRIRLGRDELVLLQVTDEGRVRGRTRDTAITDICQGCGHEHAASLECPQCGRSVVIANQS